ncbi:DNA replication and repair protein RecO [Anaerobacterium chartisolvens]|uniref:DNA repair protein RecO n=1 Tax=Anaerobacterium chartisolvens TaxID=1297424 RepID=A0A369AXF5_9FIRM|nr:DNA repair protein RecO [Anaerobacterium chartisolvens]RCX13843.1 DNA replication and repair protein RecO [Anaerobacterium chartisolvens]
MGYIKTKGIIIKEINTGEADKILTIFSRNYGKISGSAKGARRPKNKLAAATQMLCYSDFVLFKGRDMYSINSCDIIEPFYEIRNDVVKLTYCAHFVDIINDAIQEGQPAPKALQLFLNSLHLLAKTEKPPELIARIFEMRLLSILGYAPYLKCCIECGNADLSREVFFSFKQCGVLCQDCGRKEQSSINISQGTLRALRHIAHCGFNELFCFDLAPPLINEMGRICKRYLRERLEREYTKLDFLKSLNMP